MRDSARSTTWTCDSCGTEAVRTDIDQESPPSGWRLVKLLPLYVNLALEPKNPRDCIKRIMCGGCFAAPVVMADVFSRDG